MDLMHPLGTNQSIQSLEKLHSLLHFWFGPSQCGASCRTLVHLPSFSCKSQYNTWSPADVHTRGKEWAGGQHSPSLCFWQKKTGTKKACTARTQRNSFIAGQSTVTESTYCSTDKCWEQFWSINSSAETIKVHRCRILCLFIEINKTFRISET